MAVMAGYIRYKIFHWQKALLLGFLIYKGLLPESRAGQPRKEDVYSIGYTSSFLFGIYSS